MPTTKENERAVLEEATKNYKGSVTKLPDEPSRNGNTQGHFQQTRFHFQNESRIVLGGSTGRPRGPAPKDKSVGQQVLEARFRKIKQRRYRRLAYYKASHQAVRLKRLTTL